MTFLQLQTFVASTLMKRTDQAAIIPSLITQAHLEIQRKANWRCMEETASLVCDGVASNGLPLPEDYKTARMLWLPNKTPILPSTEKEMNMIYRQAADASQVPGMPVDGTSLIIQRWYVKGTRLMMEPDPDTTITYTFDYYAIQDTYSLDGDSDWFSINIPDVIGLCAAWKGSMSVWQDDRAGMFKGLYEEALATALASDSVAKQGAMATVYRPTLPNMYGGTRL